MNSDKSKKGFFITIEGPEGAGKSTLAGAIEKFLVSHGRTCLRTREPGGTPLAEKLRGVLKQHCGDETLHTMTELFLMEAARVQHVEEVIRPAVERGCVVICDRFYDSTSAYQGGARSVDMQVIKQLNDLAVSGCHPDLTLLLDLPVECGFARTGKRQETQGEFDRFEQEGLAFHNTVRKTFLELAGRDPERIKVIDASRTPSEISLEVEKLIYDALF